MLSWKINLFSGEMYMFSKKKAQFVLVDENSVDELEKEASGKENGFSQGLKTQKL